MTTEPQRPEINTATSAASIGEETVALARRHSEITKRLTRKQTARRIDALRSMSASNASAQNADTNAAQSAEEAAV